MPRQPITFTSHEQTLIGVFHTPTGAGPHPAVLFLHGFNGTKVEPHRMYVKAAEALAARGVAALRFDFRGAGDSEGETEEMTVPGQVDDARAALDWLLARPEVDAGRTAVLGFSLGGAVAALLAPQAPNLRAVALWAPLADFGTWEDEAHVARLQGRIDLRGDVIGYGFYQSTAGLDPAAALAQAAAPVHLVYGTADTWAAEQAARYQAALPAERLRVETVAGANHTFDAAHWERSLFELSLPWLVERLKGA